MKTKLKFLMITTFYPPYNFGGDGIFVYRLSNELAERGHSVDVVHCVDSYDLLKRKEAKGDYPNHANIIVHSIKSKVGAISPIITQQTGHSMFKNGTIRDLIEHKDFDVINYHNMSLIGLEVLSLGNAIKFYTTHEYWLVCPMHVLWKFGKIPCEKRQCIPCQIKGLRPVQLWRYSGMKDKALKHIDRFISPSLSAMKKHQEWGINGKFKHIPNFLPNQKPIPGSLKDSQINENRPYFLYVGRLEKIKGVHTLIPIFRKFQTCDLLIAGAGSYEKNIKKDAENIPNITFLGNLNYESLRTLYRHATAVIVPSLWYEVFGLVVLESLAEKTPVITNNIGALGELVRFSKGGYIYNSQDELEQIIKNFHLNPKLCNELGVQGNKSYLRYWTSKNYINEYYGLIKEVAYENKKNSPSIEALNLEL